MVFLLVCMFLWDPKACRLQIRISIERYSGAAGEFRRRGPRPTPKFENLVVRAVEPSELRSTDLNLLVRARVPQGVNPDWVSQ